MSRHEDEDDLDDLDEFLDDFSNEIEKQSQSKGKGTQDGDRQSNVGNESTVDSKSKPPDSKDEQPAADLDLAELDEEFAKQLQLGMDNLMKELDQSPDARDQFESLVSQMGAATGAPTAQPSVNQDNQDTNNENTKRSLQDTISKTMDRIKESGQTVDQDIAQSETDTFMEEMMKQLESAMVQPGEAAAGGDSGNGDLSGMLMTMLEELVNKDILYDPMKELYERYPAWLAENESKTSSEDLERYKKQFSIVTQVVSKFDSDNYREDDPATKQFLVERMLEMQELGSPPTDLMGSLPSGLSLPPEFDSSAGGAANTGCPVS